MNALRLTLAGVVLALAGRAAEPAITPKDRDAPPEMMESVTVDADFTVKQSFGFTMNVRKDRETQMVRAIYVVQVQPGSDAARKGLAPRVRIYRINGRPVEDFRASFLAGTELNQLFVDRPEGDRIVLEISIPGHREPSVVTLVQHRVRIEGQSALPPF